MKRCVICNVEFQPQSNRQKYCKECSIEVKKEQVNKALIKYYKKK